MKLIAFGDSFTYGLIKEPVRLAEKQCHLNSFINHLANMIPEFNGSWDNYAQCGSSNKAIASVLYNTLPKIDLKNSFIFIGWSTHTRNTEWSREFKQYRTRVWERHDTMDRLLFDTESSILFVENLLTKLNVPYCMVQAFHDHTEDNFLIKKDYEYKNWINWNKPNNTLFDICTNRYLSKKKFSDNKIYFRDRNVDKKYLAECLHPNEQGHKLIASTIKPYIEKIICNYKEQ